MTPVEWRVGIAVYGEVAYVVGGGVGMDRASLVALMILDPTPPNPLFPMNINPFLP